MVECAFEFVSECVYETGHHHRERGVSERGVVRGEGRTAGGGEVTQKLKNEIIHLQER